MSDPNAARTEIWTVARLLDWTRGYFARRSVGEPRLAAEILLAEALACKRIELYTQFDRVPEQAVLDRFRELVRRAAAHTPISYLVGSKEFFSLQFEVSEAVLIPRPETEILVEKTIDFVRAAGNQEITFLDLGTGSGCIVVSILKYLPSARAVATDLSPEALEVARRNAARHGVEERIRFTLADRLALPPETVPEGGFNLIVSNPPYIALHEVETLDVNVRDYEPKSALTDSADGLSFFRTIASEGADLLRPEGSVFVEIAEDQSQAVRDIFHGSGRFEHAETWRDMVGPFDRILRFRRSSR